MFRACLARVGLVVFIGTHSLTFAEDVDLEMIEFLGQLSEAGDEWIQLLEEDRLWETAAEKTGAEISGDHRHVSH